jgi:HipA-like protein
MALDPWRELDVTGWHIESPEPRGKRAKAWLVAPDGSVWLRKEPLVSRPAEVAIEAATARLARAVGLEAPETHACVWEDGKRGLLVRRFLDPHQETLASGSERLRVTYQDYDPELYGHHTLRRVMASLELFELAAKGADLLRPFARMLTFDAWVGNSDRHQENWAILVNAAGSARLAPTFDTAACFGAELDDAKFSPAHLTQAKIEKYIERCRSGFGDGTAHGLVSQATVVSELAAYPVWVDNVCTWVAAFEQEIDAASTFLATIPDGWLSPARRAFAERLLRQRLLWLKDRLP